MLSASLVTGYWLLTIGGTMRIAIDADTPGLTTNHLEQIPYRRLTRPIFPFDEFEWDGATNNEHRVSDVRHAARPTTEGPR